MARQANLRTGTPLERGWSLSPFMLLQRDMNRLLEDVFMTAGNGPSQAQGADVIMPTINVSETENELRITAEMPGVNEDDIDVTLNDDLLTIRAVKQAERREDDENLHVVERTFGTFQRTLRLPFQADPAQVKASVENGVLTVTVPKTKEQENSRRIAVQGRKDAQVGKQGSTSGTAERKS
jgi:HSP20 family protein